MTFNAWKYLKFFMNRNFPPFAKLLKLRMIGPKIVNFFKDIVTNVVKARDDQGIVRSDIIQLMMKTRDKNSGPEFDINEMTAQAFVFFVTGFAVVNETLRLYQEVAFINRICVTKTELPPGIPNGEPIIIKPGDTVQFPSFLSIVIQNTTCIHKPASANTSSIQKNF
ncbi:uncharacterized protein LOC105206318 [Solenopsis invicta]|uniref:uncharacterized protein LOC105206318 n=1 Tax=Solenopsis invicta TaxID=13686 RepID=UPI00193E81A1|nr:uncharacterized protein LOC105206318 [Solenopsis invicta]